MLEKGEEHGLQQILPTFDIAILLLSKYPEVLALPAKDSDGGEP